MAGSLGKLGAVLAPSLICLIATCSTAAIAGQPVAVKADDETQLRQDVATVAAHYSEDHLLALWRLGFSGPLAGAALNTLRPALWDRDWRVRWLALRAQAQNCTMPLPPEDIRVREPQQLSDLRQLAETLPWEMQDSAPEVRALAARCMLALGPEYRWPSSGNAEYGDLITALSDPDPAVNELLQQVLAQWISLEAGK